MSSTETINISIGSQMYNRFGDLPNTIPNVFAEFIDNALQSYRDNKTELHATNPDYGFCVKISFERDNDGKILSATIYDNAAGISSKRYKTAFQPAVAPEDNTGLNEFGMGFKTAACWLGDEWEVTTKALGENETKRVRFNLKEVSQNELKELPIYKETASPNEHFTSFIIRQISREELKNSVDKLKQTLASVYRISLRNKEMRLIVDDELLEFTEPKILVAPYYKNRDGEPIVWKKDVNIELGPYKAHGYVALLAEMSNTNNGFVLIRRGRVVQGAENGNRYISKALCGSLGSPRYKRIFGELELEGFNVSFNKNKFQDAENLEALMGVIRDEIRHGDDIIMQAEKYRLDERQKLVRKIVKKHETTPQKDKVPIYLSTDLSRPQPVAAPTLFQSLNEEVKTERKEVPPMDKIEDKYNIDNEAYIFRTEFFEDEKGDLLYNDVKDEDKKIIVCKINVAHPFLEHYKNKMEPAIQLLKTLSVAKFATNKSASNDAAKMMEYFNEYIKTIKL